MRMRSPLAALVATLLLAASCASAPEPTPAPAPAPAPAATTEPGFVTGTSAASLASCRRGPPPAAPGAAETGEAHHGHHAPGGHATHRFQDAEKWTKVFDDPARDAWQKPELVLATLALRPADVVADVGAGTGYFSVRFARAVPQGKVLAQDVEPTLVQFLTERAAKEQLPNLIPVLGGFEDPRLPEPADVIFVCDTYHHIAAPVPFFEKVAAMAKPGARLVIVDFTPGELPVGPPEQARTPPAQLVEELGRAGWKLTGFDCASLPYQYLATFTR